MIRIMTKSHGIIAFVDTYVNDWHNTAGQAHRSPAPVIHIPDEWLAEELILE